MNHNLKVYFTIEALDEYSKKFEEVKKTAQTNTKEVEEVIKRSNKKILNDNKKTEEEQIGSFDRLKKAAMAYFSFSFLKSSVQSFAYRDKYISKIQAISHATNKEMDAFNKGLREKTKNSIHSVDEILTGAFVGTKSGIKIDKLDEFASITDQVFTAVSSKGGESMGQTATAIGTAVNSFNGSLEQLSDIMTRVIDTSKGFNINEFQQSLAKTAPFTKKFNVDMETMMSLLTSFTEKGVSGAVASTKMQSIFKVLQSKGTENIGQKLGLGKDFNLSGKNALILLTKLKDKYGKLRADVRIKKLSQLFGKGDSTMALNSLIDDLDNINKKYEDLSTKAKGFRNEASSKISQGAYGNYMQLLNTIENIKTTIGSIVTQTGLLQYFQNILKVIDETLNKVINLKEQLKGGIESMKEGKAKKTAETAYDTASQGVQTYIGLKLGSKILQKLGISGIAKKAGGKAGQFALKQAGKVGVAGATQIGLRALGALATPSGATATIGGLYLAHKGYKHLTRDKQKLATEQENIDQYSNMSFGLQDMNFNITIDNLTGKQFDITNFQAKSEGNNKNLIVRQQINNK